MLDSVCHMTLKFLKNRIFGVNTSRFCHVFCNVIIDVITLRCQICKPLVVYRFYFMALYQSQTRCCVIRQGIVALIVDFFVFSFKRRFGELL